MASQEEGKRMIVEGEGLINIFHEVFKKNLRYICNSVFILMLLVLFFSWVGGNYARDNTDTVDGARSGMKLRTDYQTKCQYLETDSGGITPRLNSMGEHMCGQHSAGR